MIEQELVRYGYVFVFLGTILEGDATLVAASYLAHRGYFEMGKVVALAVLATAGANHFYFAVARRNSKALLARMESNPRLREIRGWVLRRGGFLLLVSRFLFGLRVAIPAACGATGMHPVRFAAYNVAGAIVWGILIGAMGYLGGHVLSVLYQDLRRHEWEVAAALAAATALFALWRGRGKDLREARIAVKRPGQLGDDSVRMVMEKELPRWIGPEPPLRGKSQREDEE